MALAFFAEPLDGFDDVIEHFAGEAGVGADEERLVHDFVGTGQVADDTEGLRAILLQLHQDRLADQIAPEEHPAVDLRSVEVPRKFEFFEGSGRFDPEHKSKPGADRAVAGGVPGEAFRSPASGMGGEHEIKELLEVTESISEVFPVVDPGLDEGGEFLELGAADGGLDVQGLQVVAKVGVNEFVVITLGEVAELPVEPFGTGVVDAAGTPAVATPIAEAVDDGFKFEAVDDVDGAPFAESEMVRRVERLGGEVSESPGVSAVVSAAEGIAVVFDEPEVVFFAKLGDGSKVEGVSQSVGEDDGLGFPGDEGVLELIDSSVEGDGIVVDEDGDKAVLDDGSDGRREASGDGDDFIADVDAAFAEFRAGESGDGEKIGGRSGVAEDALFDA